MKVVFMKECAADGCYRMNLGNGRQLCDRHQRMYDGGIPFKGFYGKTVLKKEFQQKTERKVRQ